MKKNKGYRVILSALCGVLVGSFGLGLVSCKNVNNDESTSQITETEIYEANKAVKLEMSAEDFKLTSCQTRQIEGAKNSMAVMLNSDSGFIANSRGFAEISFDAPESGYFQIVVSGGANEYTPVECWINDYEQEWLHFNTSGYTEFASVGLIHYFHKGENVLRFLGPGSAYYAAIDAVYVRGFNTPNNVASALELSGIEIPEGTQNVLDVLPKIAGFTYEFGTSSDTAVITKEGRLLPDGKDGADKTCDIKIKVKRDDFTATSKTISVTVPKDNGSAQSLAEELNEKYEDGITVVKNQTSLVLDDFDGIATVRVEECQPEGIIYLTGFVTSPVEDTVVNVKFRVEKDNGDVAVTENIPVTVEGIGDARLQFMNPLADGADPFVQYIDGYYHHIQAVHSSTNASLVLQRSKSFIDYSDSALTTIYTFSEYSDVEYNHEVWGWFPIIEWDGYYYIYYAASNGPSANHRMFVLKSNKPGDLYSGFTELGMVNTGGIWAIGLNFFEWKGEHYAIWSGWIENNKSFPQCTYMAKMENPWTIGERVKISQPEYDWEGVGIGTPIQEGSMVYNFDGKLIMLYNADASFSNRYRLGMLDYVGGDSAEDVLNPDNWVKRPKPVFDSTDTVKAPGVPCLIKSPDQTEWWLVYHCAKYDGAGWSRCIMAQPVTKDKNGGPVFGLPVNKYIPINMPSGDDYDPSRQQYEIYQAKNAQLSGNAKVEKDYLSTYGYAVTGIKKEGDKIVFKVNAEKAGAYRLLVQYAAYTPNSSHLLKVNGTMARLPIYRYLGPQDYYNVTTDIMLNAGENEISFEYFEGGEVKLDFIGIKYVGE